MTEIDHVVRAAIRVVSANRTLLRAVEDGVSKEAQQRYAGARTYALEELDKAVLALSRAAPRPKTPSAPFDWLGAAKAARAVIDLVKTAKTPKDVVAGVGEIIDAEVIRARPSAGRKP